MMAVVARHFNTAGPVTSDIHYLIPPLERIALDEVLALIDARKYFVLQAPRQTGKTSVLAALVRHLNAQGRYRALYINIEAGQAFRESVPDVIQTILSILGREAASCLGDPFIERNREAALAAGAGDALGRILAAWCEQSPLPVCLMVDEIDSLVGDSLIAVLRQLRAGYMERPRRFPQSIVLCGVRDVRDYRIHGTKELVTGGSAFNVKAESLRIGDFTPAEIRRLYEQHTNETGQVFEEEVYPLVWDLTRGQPWLVNALAYEACFKIQKDRARPITAEHIRAAKERLILDRVTHLDQLTDKLREPRVRRVIEPILQGEPEALFEPGEDDSYAIDLGLVRLGQSGLEIANGIYKEVIPRELNERMQRSLLAFDPPEWRARPDGRLDMRVLLASFQRFYRDSEAWLGRYEYREAGPQLLLQAFLQRVVNGGGRIEREYALGRRRTDLLVIWNWLGGVQRIVIEIKMVRRKVETTLSEALPQVRDYMDKTGTKEGHLVLFHRDPELSWETKVFQRTVDGIEVWGM